nr:GMC oxidoreductase [Nakamurella flavida]
MAIARRADGTLVRTGPNRVWPPLADGSDPGFTLLDATVCTGLLHRDGQVQGVTLSSLRDGTDTVVRARQVVVAADALRTPQLLFASGIRPPALGRYLDEHAFLSGAVTVTPDMLDLPARPADEKSDEPFRHALWVPYRGADRPFHGGVLCRPTDAGPAGSLLVTLSWYVPAEVSADNRLHFDDDATDATGLPRFSVRFVRSPADLRRIADAQDVLLQVASALTRGKSATPCALLEPGSSLHYTGTVRMSAADDGTGVCDATGRVWGFDNLFLAGNGVIPSALAANSTLTAVAVAVRTVRRLVAELR